jgi:shikimate kinase
MSKKIFYLAGFMASGKSTIGKILANTIGWDFFDLDSEIEKKEDRKITTIFKVDGEVYFRNLETQILSELSTGNQLIISLGGGTLISQDNRKIIRQKGNLIFLKSSPEVAYRRLKHKRDRPVILHVRKGEEQDEEMMIRKIGSLMKERMKYYEKADYTFDTDNESIGTTVDKIAMLVDRSVRN